MMDGVKHMKDKVSSIGSFSVDYREDVKNAERIMSSRHHNKVIATGSIPGRRFCSDCNVDKPKENDICHNVKIESVIIDSPSVGRRYAPRNKKGRPKAVVAAVAMIMAISSIIYAISSIGNGYHNLIAPRMQLNKWNEFITPVVMQDPQPFDDVTQATENMVLTAGMWRAIMCGATKTDPQFDEAGRVMIKSDVVKKACTELFGDKCKFNPKAYSDKSFFTYNENEDKFHIEAISNYNNYIPYIKDCKSKGDIIRVDVGYVEPGDPWRQGENNNPTPQKSMIYELKSKNGVYYIDSIKIPSETTEHQ